MVATLGLLPQETMETKMSKIHKHVIVRKFGIDCGHRLYEHDGKCKNIHGHRYTFHVYFTSDDLDKLGRVVDFGWVKNKIGNWLENNWDHGMLINENDPIGELWKQESWMTAECIIPIELLNALKELNGMKHFFLPCNPTAENLASQLYIIANQLMEGTGVTVCKVKCGETPNCEALAFV